MISKKHQLVGFFLAFFVTANPSYSADVVELFTSKYCPACPPADRAIATLAEQSPEIITLSCHVTYFDRAGRKNLFSKDFCNARQSVYRLSLKTGKLFTPMAIVNGQTLTKAKRIQDIQNALQQTDKGYYDTPIIALNGQYLDITLPNIPMQNTADVWLFEYAKAPQQQGYSHYKNAVTNITKLMRWNGRRTSMAFPVNPGFNKGFAVVVQDYKNGILAAAKTP